MTMNSRKRRRLRELVWRAIASANDGLVLCYVCSKPVLKPQATLEHIIPKARGGTNDLRNLAISHQPCNLRRGSPAHTEC